MKRILYCGDAFVETGFGRVAENLLPALTKEYEVVVMPSNYHGDPHPEAKKYKVYPAMLHGTDPFGAHRIAEIIQREKPDLIWVTNDIWIAINLWNQAKPLQEQFGFKWFVYTPIDSYGLFPSLAAPMLEWDGLATYTEFAAKELRLAGYDKHIDVVGHGTDFTKFFSLNKAECRKELGVPNDVFIVFNGNRNQPRKRIDLTIKGFIEFAKDKPDARLWLHMGKKDMGWPIVELFKRVARDAEYDATGKLILTSPDFSVDNCLPVEQLNKVYNAVDVGVNTCIGEGWGLVNTEHAATGVAQVVPNHTSLKEIFHNQPRIEIESWEVDCNYGLDRGQPSPIDMADILNVYYYDREKLAEMGAQCWELVHREHMTWPYIGDQMLDIVERTLAIKKDDKAEDILPTVRID